MIGHFKLISEIWFYNLEIWLWITDEKTFLWDTEKYTVFQGRVIGFQEFFLKKHLVPAFNFRRV